MLIPLLRAAPKWDAAIYLLESLTDPDADVRTAASRWFHVWLDDVNLSQVPPAGDQLRKIHVLLARVDSHLSPDAAKLVRLTIGAH